MTRNPIDFYLSSVHHYVQKSLEKKSVEQIRILDKNSKSKNDEPKGNKVLKIIFIFQFPNDLRK